MILMREITGADSRLRRRLDLVQHAVDAVADDQPVLERLDVDVGRAHLERVGDDEAHHPDDRRLGREVLQLLDVGVEGDLVAALLDVAHDLAERGLAGAVQALERRLELGRDRDHRPDLAAGDHAERADRVLVGRVGHRQRELVLVLAHRQRAAFAQEPLRDALLEDRELRVRRDVDHRQPELRGQRLGDVALRAGAQRHQQRPQLLAGILLQAQRAFQPRGVELAALDQDFAEAFAGGGVQGRRGRRRRVGQNGIDHNTPTPGNPLSSPANQAVANDFCNKPSHPTPPARRRLRPRPARSTISGPAPRRDPRPPEQPGT